jgi:hypothetical protein
LGLGSLLFQGWQTLVKLTVIDYFGSLEPNSLGSNPVSATYKL